MPVIVAGTVYGVFELGEKLASQRAKDALSKWLLTFDVRKVGALPDGTRELFERVFGERHFSLKCFSRSVAFSLGAMIFIALLLFLIFPEEVLRKKAELFYWLNFALWLPWSILIDYVSLFKTRLVLGFITRMGQRNALLAVAVGVIDYIVYRLLFSTGLAFLGVARSGIPLDWTSMRVSVFIPIFIAIMSGIIPDFMGETMVLFPRNVDLLFILFWAGFVPSIWMWLYVLALFVTRALFRSERVLTWLRWSLDIEKAPFRSIGAVAAAIAFMASVAILLVSVEVSRFGAAA